jgi:serine/threonine protein kinase
MSFLRAHHHAIPLHLGQSKRALSTGEQFSINAIDLIVKQKLGRGAQRTVYDVSDIHNHHFAVMEFNLRKKEEGSPILGELFEKFVDDPEHKKVQLAAVDREVDMKQRLGKHQNLDTEILGRKDKEHGVLVLKPLADSTLVDHLVRSRATFPSAMQLMKGSIDGLEYMHQKAIIHADVKPENLLVNKGVIKISDFDHSTGKEEKARAPDGDPRYVDPSARHLDEKCDHYALYMSLNDIFSSPDWLTGDPAKDRVILDFRKYLQDSVKCGREMRPNLEALKTKMDEIIARAEKVGGFPSVNDMTEFYDSGFRSMLEAEEM